MSDPEQHFNPDLILRLDPYLQHRIVLEAISLRISLRLDRRRTVIARARRNHFIARYIDRFRDSQLTPAERRQRARPGFRGRPGLAHWCVPDPHRHGFPEALWPTRNNTHCPHCLRPLRFLPFALRRQYRIGCHSTIPHECCRSCYAHHGRICPVCPPGRIALWLCDSSSDEQSSDESSDEINQ